MRSRKWHNPLPGKLVCAALVAAVLACGCEDMSPEGISFMSWSPDGRMLASIYNGVIYVGAPDGTMPLRNFADLDLAENHLSWSPDSGAIAYASAQSGSWDIWILDIKGGKSVHIVVEYGRPFCIDCICMLKLSIQKGRNNIRRQV